MMNHRGTKPQGLRPFANWLWDKSPWLVIGFHLILWPFALIMGVGMGVKEAHDEMVSGLADFWCHR